MNKLLSFSLSQGRLVRLRNNLHVRISNQHSCIAEETNREYEHEFDKDPHEDYTVCPSPVSVLDIIPRKLMCWWIPYYISYLVNKPKRDVRGIVRQSAPITYPPIRGPSIGPINGDNVYSAVGLGRVS